MTKQRAPFMPVTPDIDDDALETLARDKGVGSLVKPVANRSGEGGSTGSTVPSVSAPEAIQEALPAEAKGVAALSVAQPEPTPRNRMKAVNFEVPDYAWTELKILAARQQVSVRHIIMAALKEKGIPITDADMVEDGRRLRS